jgi:preprotein translocase subunit SecF
MLQVLHHANFRLMWGLKYGFMVFSAICVVGSIAVMLTKGFNLGIDFAGGTAVQVRFAEAPHVDAIRAALEGAGLGDVTLQQIGDPGDNEILVRIERRAEGAGGDEGGGVSARVIEALRKMEGMATTDRIDLNAATETAIRDWVAAHLPAPADAAAPAPDAAAMAKAIVAARNARGGLFTDAAQIAAIPGVDPAIVAVARDQAAFGKVALRGVDFVGPTAGKELLENTAWAIIWSVAGILCYVWVRFRHLSWGAAAVLALVHDVVIAAGAMSLTGREFSVTVVASLLTILGYSINDTIVVFDRIRENLRLYREYDFEKVVNASVNQTLSRTILTSLTVFIAVFALFLYGGEKLNPMSFCLLVGVVFGTYSSVFVAAALLVVIYQRFGAKYVKA